MKRLDWHVSYAEVLRMHVAVVMPHIVKRIFLNARQLLPTRVRVQLILQFMICQSKSAIGTALRVQLSEEGLPTIQALSPVSIPPWQKEHKELKAEVCAKTRPIP